MYRLDVSKGLVDSYAISVSKEGSCVEDHIGVDTANVELLLTECANIIKTGDPGSTIDTGKVTLDTYNSAYQLIAHIAENYVRSYFLTITDVKLFQASLKRAIDG